MSNGRTQTRQPQRQTPPPEPEPVQEEPKNQPAFVVRIRNIRGAIWQNTDNGGQVYFTVTLSRFYRDGDGWRTSSSLGRDDLLIAAKVLDQCHTWITGTQQNEELAF